MTSKRTRKSPKRALGLPDLELSKTAVVNRLSSETGQRTYEHAINEFVRWYCSEPRLAFNRTVVPPIPDSSRTARLCSCDDQSSARGRPSNRL